MTTDSAATADSIQATTMTKDKKELRRDLSDRLIIVNKKARHYRRLNTLLLVVAVTFGLLVSGLAGDSFKGGAVIAKSIAVATTRDESTNPMEGWRNVYGIIAVLSLIATLATGFNNSLKIGEHQTKSIVCAGTLDGLLLEAQGAKTSETLDKVRDDFQKLLKDYADYTR